jgi:hypothetical protein
MIDLLGLDSIRDGGGGDTSNSAVGLMGRFLRSPRHLPRLGKV